MRHDRGEDQTMRRVRVWFLVSVLAAIPLVASADGMPQPVADALRLASAAVPGGDRYEASQRVGLNPNGALNCDVPTGYRQESYVNDESQTGNYATAQLDAWQAASNAARCALVPGPNAEILADQSASFQVEVLRIALAYNTYHAPLYVQAAHRVTAISEWLKTSQDHNLRNNGLDHLATLRCIYQNQNPHRSC